MKTLLTRAPCALLTLTLGAAALAHSADPAALTTAPAATTINADATTPDPPAIVRHCLDAIGQTVRKTAEHIAAFTKLGVRRIAALDAHGAPPPVLIRSAEVSAHEIKYAAAIGRRGVTAITYACAMTLHQLGAPDQLIGVLFGARERALKDIGAVQDRGLRAIREALNRALSDSMSAVAS